MATGKTAHNRPIKPFPRQSDFRIPIRAQPRHQSDSRKKRPELWKDDATEQMGRHGPWRARQELATM